MSPGRRTKGFLKLLPLALLVTRLAQAQANYESALIGGHSSLMGGTGVVNGTDAAAPLQNPATTVRVAGTSFVFSTFFMQLSSRQIEVDPDLVEQVTRGDTDLDEAKFSVLPTSTCIFFDAGRKPPGQRGGHKFSICVAEPESESFSLNSRALASVTGSGTGFQNRFLTQAYSKKVYALGWATTLGRGVSVGVTPMLEDVTHYDSEQIVTLLSDAMSSDQAVGATAEKSTNVIVRRASSLGASALVGVRYQLGSRWAAGLSLQSPSLNFSGSYRNTRSTSQALGTAEDYQQESGSARFTYPFRLALGVAGQIKKTRLEINSYIHGGRDDFVQVTARRQTITLGGSQITDVGDKEAHFQEALKPTVNLGIGVELPLSDDWGLLLGFLTDFSGLPGRPSGLPADSLLFRQRTDLLHGSIGFSWSPRVGTLLFGTRAFYGEGTIAISDPRTVPPELQSQKGSRWGISLIVSGQLSLEMLALADPTGLLEKATGEATQQREGSSPAPTQ